MFQRFTRGISSGKKVAVTCPGQGALYKGLLAPYVKYRPVFQEYLSEIDEALQENFSEKLLNRDTNHTKEFLTKTSRAQPAIVATTYIINQLLKKVHGVDLFQENGISYVLGHSLGEYSALLLSGGIDLYTAMQLVHQRGVLMEHLTQGENGMTALIFRPQHFSRVCAVAQQRRVLANINSEQQVAISGRLAEIQEAVEELNASSKIIMRQISLPTTIPFHNKVLDQIEPELLKYLDREKDPIVPQIMNLTAAPKTGKRLRLIIEANSKPVRWNESLKLLSEKGVTDVVNLGPGDLLKAFMARFPFRTHSVDSLESMKELRTYLYTNKEF